jgi:hypothetical protein
MAKVKAPSKAQALAEKFRKASELSWGRVWDDHARKMLDDCLNRAGIEKEGIGLGSETISARPGGLREA